MGDDRLGDEERSFEVDVDDAVPSCFFKGFDRSVSAVEDASEVEEHIDAAHPLDCRCHAPFNARTVRDIDVPAFGDGVPDCGVDNVCGILGCGVVNVKDGDSLGTTFGGHDGGRSSDACRGAGDDDAFCGEIGGHDEIGLLSLNLASRIRRNDSAVPDKEVVSLVGL